jgi:hypothetical protein
MSWAGSRDPAPYGYALERVAFSWPRRQEASLSCGNGDEGV